MWLPWMRTSLLEASNGTTYSMTRGSYNGNRVKEDPVNGGHSAEFRNEGLEDSEPIRDSFTPQLHKGLVILVIYGITPMLVSMLGVKI